MLPAVSCGFSWSPREIKFPTSQFVARPHWRGGGTCHRLDLDCQGLFGSGRWEGGAVSEAGPDPSSRNALVVTDVSSIPDEAPPELIYHHKVSMIAATRRLWRAREVIFTLAERDFRVQYKQASLGVMWALLTPLLTLGIMVVVFSRTKTFGTEGIPFALFAFVGILCWTFFAGALGSGGSSLLANKVLLAKTQFPRECFPLENMGVTGLNTVISWV